MPLVSEACRGSAVLLLLTAAAIVTQCISSTASISGALRAVPSGLRPGGEGKTRVRDLRLVHSPHTRALSKRGKLKVQPSAIASPRSERRHTRLVCGPPTVYWHWLLVHMHGCVVCTTLPRLWVRPREGVALVRCG